MHRFAALITATFAGLLTTAAPRAQDTAAPAGEAIPELRAALDALLGDPVFDGGRVGVHVRDLRDGRVLSRHQDRSGFMPASNMKLIAVATALDALGPEFRFVTTLRVRGRIEAGVLRGDLLLVGDGDPTFGGRHERATTDVLDRLVAKFVAATGVTTITGEVLAVAGAQRDSGLGRGWAWDYASEGYAAPFGGLCFAENVLRVTFAPSKRDGLPTATIRPEPPAFDVDVCATNTRPGEADRMNAILSADGAKLTVGGAIAKDAEPRVATLAIRDPIAVAARSLRARLAAAGVAVQGKAGAGTGTAQVVVASEPSPPLHRIVTTLNKVSQNLYAEQVLRHAARAAGASGTSAPSDTQVDLAAGVRTAEAMLTRLGVDVRGLRIADGSGLSRLNLARPVQIADLLAAMHTHRHGEVFLASLPVAGIDGTLRGRFTTGPAAARVRAKSGYIARVVALSGYVPRPDPSAPPIVFAILTNDFVGDDVAARAAVDRFVQALAQHAGWN